MNSLRLPLLLGACHAVADGTAGLLLAHLPGAHPGLQVALLVLFYNALAFGSQPLLGWWADDRRQPRVFTVAGLLALAAALPCAWLGGLTAAVVLAGVGSAAFHVGAGALTLRALPGRASALGVFAAPGVFGLAAGGALAMAGYFPALPFAGALVGLAGIVLAQPRSENAPVMGDPERLPSLRSSEPILENHDWLMILLLAAISLRSAVWTAFELATAGRTSLLLAMAVAAAVGKLAGGWLADRCGWRRWTVGALGLAAPLLALGGRRPACLLAGVALLQSTVPVALAITGRLLPSRPATAAGLALGLAVALGGLPSVVGGQRALSLPVGAFALTLAAAIAFCWLMQRNRETAVEPASE